ncbi:MAG TPA: D-alanyl-D-alanine carboxypeptidase [Bacteroidales bacterium]|nr:D-alanyl-D-alanine carboxypeptidase [Bacteroidales bacterium]
MPLRRTLISLLVFLQLLVSCVNNHPGGTDKAVLPAVPKSDTKEYNTLLAALNELKQDPLLNGASVGYMVVDVTAPKPQVVADYQAKKPMVPASTLKIFVTGAALEYFGKSVVPEVTITNQMSVNWRSSKLLRRIGGKVYNEATTTAGTRAILDFWSSRGVDTDGMYFYDGNGLSHNNAISPKQLVDALNAMRHSPWFDVFYQSLPLAGITGTLHRAMKGSAAEGRIHAKTGTIGRVKSFAGYVTTLSGRRLIFSLIVNDYSCRMKQVKKKLEEVMIRMAEV